MISCSKHEYTFVFVVIASCCTFAVQANWMYLGLIGVPQPLQQQQIEPGAPVDDPAFAQASVICGALTTLSPPQIEVCMKHPSAIYLVAKGAHTGIQECQYQFRNDRWNCSTNEEDEDVFGYVLKAGSRETAFIHAVTSAGVVHAVTQGCSAGELTECGCDTSDRGRNTPAGWKWGGCSDNIHYGLDFTRNFVDSSEQVESLEKSERWLNRVRMNLHNNEAGREIVQSLMRIHCRCHGVSGSCELKTCWKTMPSFNEVGDTLKKKYDDAILLQNTIDDGKLRKKRNKVRAKKEIKKSDLIHVEKSPNFCKRNSRKGILGTKNRKCSKSSRDADSCSSLCCGRGYDTQVVKTKEKCQCKFVWCCYVKCRTCEKEQHIYSCK